jgi:hypothetical protein
MVKAKSGALADIANGGVGAEGSAVEAAVGAQLTGATEMTGVTLVTDDA